VRRFLAVAVAAMLAGCAGSRIEQEPPAGLIEFTPAGRITEVWSERVGASAAKLDVRLVPRLDGGVIYAADPDGYVSAFDARTGKNIWETRVETTLSGGVGTGSDLVVVGGRKGQVTALEKSSGKKRWESRVSSEVLAPPAVGTGVVVVQTVDGRLTGFSADDGKRLWMFERGEPALSLRGTSTPLVIGDHVVAGFANGKIVGVGLQDGRAGWELPVAQPRGRNEVERLVDVDAPILFRGDTLFAVSFQGKVIAADMRAGRIAWTRDVSSYSGMDADKSNLYVTDEKGIVTAFDLHSGAVVWKQDRLHGRQLSAPTVAGSLVVVGDFEGYLHWLSRDDGQPVARERVGTQAIQAQPIADGTVVYAANVDGTLAALRYEKN
jgi:outer membrane protein assembly factor BamB